MHSFAKSELRSFKRLNSSLEGHGLAPADARDWARYLIARARRARLRGKNAFRYLTEDAAKYCVEMHVSGCLPPAGRFTQ